MGFITRLQNKEKLKQETCADQGYNCCDCGDRDDGCGCRCHCMRDAIEQIAREVRVDFEAYYDWRENPTALDLQCAGMSKELHHKLTEAGFKAVRRVGMYLGAGEGYEPDMTLWSPEEVADFDPAEGFTHWWVEVDGTIVDISSDQFHPTERESRRVVLLPVGDEAYLPAPSPRSLFKHRCR